MIVFSPFKAVLISHILACEPVLHVDTHQAPDEVLSLLRDVVPVGGVKLKLACKCRKLYSTLIFDVYIYIHI